MEYKIEIIKEKHNFTSERSDHKYIQGNYNDLSIMTYNTEYCYPKYKTFTHLLKKKIVLLMITIFLI